MSRTKYGAGSTINPAELERIRRDALADDRHTELCAMLRELSKNQAANAAASMLLFGALFLLTILVSVF